MMINVMLMSLLFFFFLIYIQLLIGENKLVPPKGFGG